MTRVLTTHERHIEAQRYLATFIREIKHYRTTWGCPPDKVAFRDAIKAAQQECLRAVGSSAVRAAQNERRAYDKCS